jgi:Putative Ig domain
MTEQTIRGHFSFDIKVWRGIFMATVSGQFTLVINPAPPPPLVLTPAGGPLPPATVGQEYSQQFQASGGVGPYTYAIDVPPPGLALDPNSGILAGVPTQAGTAQFTITATDSQGQTAAVKTAVKAAS